MSDNNIKLDFYEHPRVWNRRINSVKEALPSNSPVIARLDKAFHNWREAPGVITPEQQKCVQELYDAWFKANEEIESLAKSKVDNRKWAFTTVISFIALLTSLVSISLSGYFQYENLKVNTQRLEMQIEAKTSKVIKPEPLQPVNKNT
ncbi:hypothetical protein [Vibrio vulnificus]|uniref:hypothetical protein n=1 Tax=Vibrio vulnificus TaxID=672 RepID=UPI0005F155D1|nr:hypothetical protein [Vibrio vulnificus]EGR0671498.1 hypothetical protein [Vibrio vulnificus]ELV8804844.1 hypothetical protein [Vibrio vulnificus]